MANNLCTLSIFVLLFPLLFLAAFGEASLLITVKNSCEEEPIWVAFVSGEGSPDLLISDTGFVLFPGQTRAVSVPSNWIGTVWARTRCGLDDAGEFHCLTGDCGSRAVLCPRGTPVPSAVTVAHFVEAAGAVTYYVSVEKGFNLVMIVTPKGFSGPHCRPTGVVDVDLNKACPKNHRVVDGDGYIIGCGSGYDNIPNTFVCFSAVFNIGFCASGFRRDTVSSPDFWEYRPYNPEESGPSNHQGSSNGNRRLFVLKIGGLVGGVTISMVLTWWIYNVYCGGSDGCCRVQIILGCCNKYFFGTNAIGNK